LFANVLTVLIPNSFNLRTGANQCPLYEAHSEAVAIIPVHVDFAKA
jgi:hypothetical protein